MGDRHPFAAHPGGEPAGLIHRLRIGDHHRGAELKRREEIAVQRIVRQTRQQAEAVGGRQLETLA